MSSWNEPIAELYTPFEDWLKDNAKHVKSYIDDAKKNLRYGWYKSGSDISLKDKSKYNSELFNTDKIQEGYKDFLKGKGVSGDAIAQKFQAGNMEADERAFYVRHAPIADLMCCAYMEGTTQLFLSDLYKNHVNKIIEKSIASSKKLRG